MSASIKNISVSIDGNQSDKFKIKIDGAPYRMDLFTMTQRLLEPCSLSFIIYKDPTEDAGEPQLKVCTAILGKEIKMTLQTGSMEQEMDNSNTEGKNATLEFEGYIMRAQARRTQSRYVVNVLAQTKDVVMDDHPDCRYYNEWKLGDIVTDCLKEYDQKNFKVQPFKEDVIFLTARYEETHYAFLRRLACRHGEWFFSNGKSLYFGKTPEGEQIDLAYPDKDIPYYNVNFQTYHQNFNSIVVAYNGMDHHRGYIGKDEIKELGHELSDAVLKASNAIFNQRRGIVAMAAGMESDDDVEASDGSPLPTPLFKEDFQSEMLRTRHNMVVYEGMTFCSKLAIGTVINIKDNFINSAESNDKSEVQQSGIRVIEVTHTFDANERYHNTFKGMPEKVIKNPPYTDRNIYPKCHHPIKAVVYDTEDPKHWGRVKVKFPWQFKLANTKDETTPWIYVGQPYTWMQSDERYAGTHLVPEKFTDVLVEFENGNVERPYVSTVMPSYEHQIDAAWYKGGNTVKAFRTRSGHTIEIHDKKDGSGKNGGYIKIYDHKTRHYVLTLSTDEKLIKLHSAGNIELEADNDVVIHAKHDLKLTADNDETVEVKNDQTIDVKNNLTYDVAKTAKIDAKEKLEVKTDYEDLYVRKSGIFATIQGGVNATLTSGDFYLSAPAGDMAIAAAGSSLDTQSSLLIKGATLTAKGDTLVEVTSTMGPMNISAMVCNFN